MPATLPAQARAVVIGGGVAGCSVAYHLAKLGWKDVVLLERKQLTSGTTWHAAGLLSQSRPSPVLQKLTTYSVDLYERLEAETGQSTGIKRSGSLFAAITDERAEEVRRLAASVRNNGLEGEIVSPSEARKIYPLLNVDDVKLGYFIPRDGQADPANVALAMAKGARMLGVKIFENVKVTGITQANGRATGVTTADGPIKTDVVVNCAGLWAREVGLMAGAAVPLQACEHFYIVTEPIAGLDRSLPVLRVQEECAYYKEDAGKILLGCFEPKAKPWGIDGVPDDHGFTTLPEDFDHFQPILEMAMQRMPALQTAGIKLFFNGPESFTQDDRFHIGEAPELRGFYVLAGFNSVGIVTAGGAGKALAEWIEGGHPPVRSHGHGCPAQSAVPEHQALSGRAGEGDAGAALRPPLAVPAVRQRPRRAAIAAARAHGEAGRLLRRGGRLGAAELVPAGGGAGARRKGRVQIFLGPSELVRARA